MHFLLTSTVSLRSQQRFPGREHSASQGWAFRESKKWHKQIPLESRFWVSTSTVLHKKDRRIIRKSLSEARSRGQDKTLNQSRRSSALPMPGRYKLPSQSMLLTWLPWISKSDNPVRKRDGPTSSRKTLLTCRFWGSYKWRWRNKETVRAATKSSLPTLILVINHGLYTTVWRTWRFWNLYFRDKY